MKKICMLTSITSCGLLGWWVGKPLGQTSAYWLSFAGNLVGVYVGYRINRDYL